MTTHKQFRVQTLNAISGAGLSRFPDDLYDVGGSLNDPDALLVRSAKLTTRRSPTPSWPSAAPAPVPTTFPSPP